MADRGRELNDKELARLERELAREYAKAKKEMIEKFNRTSKQFKALDLQKQKLVDKGKMSEAEYEKWKSSQLLKSKWMKSMIDQYSTDMVKIDKKAAEIINSKLPKMYAESFNHGTYEIENGTGISTSFTLYNKSTVTRLLRDKPDLYDEASINVSKDKRWNQQAMRSALTQGVLQGEGMDGIAKRFASVTDMDRNSAIRNARTLTTGAEASGKLDSYFRARDMGIPIKKMWESTVDDRTRASHRNLDGETRELEEKFSNGLMYPGDTSTGEGAEFYNCRCNLSSQIEGFETDMTDMSQRSNKLGDMSYDEWKKAKNKSINTVDGKDITKTWKRRTDKYAFEIEDVINAQGFDGLPTVVSEKEFEKYAKESNWIAQRTYAAPSDEMLATYRNELCNGKWYVDCSGNGHDYGMGMYTAGARSYKLTDGIRFEMNFYKDQLLSKIGTTAKQNAYDNAWEYATRNATRLEKAVIQNEGWYTFKNFSYDKSDVVNLERNNEDEYYRILKKYKDAKSSARDASENAKAVYRTDTFTLTKDAKVISYREVQNRWDEDKFEDPSSWAVAKGYDAISTRGNNDDCTYLIVLNRTKLIIKE